MCPDGNCELSLAFPLKKNLDSLEFLLWKPLTEMCIRAGIKQDETGSVVIFGTFQTEIRQAEMRFPEGF